MSEWNIIFKPFSELLSNVVDNRGKTCPTAPSGLALIATNCIKNDNLYPVYENVRYVSDETYKTWFRGHPLPGDLIFVTKGTPGRVCLVPSKVDFCIAQDMVAIRADYKKVNQKYLFAALRSAEIQSGIENLHVGSLIPHFKKGDFDKLQIPLPERELQEYIGEQYFTFSAKIDLLHRQNKTLEGMAEVLWRKMFVEEADPGWREISLLEIIDLVGGGTPKTEVSEYWDGAVPWLSAKDITSNHKCFIVQTEKDISELGLKNSAAKILPQYATIISARGTVGNYCILSKPMAFSQSNYGVLPKIDGCFFFTYLLIAFIVDELKSAAYGSVFDTITTNTFREQKIILPSKDIILSFEKMINTYFEKIYNNTIQIRTLSRLRDTLLPKLMSGEVRMKI